MCVYTHIHRPPRFLALQVVVDKLVSCCSVKSASGSSSFAYTINEKSGSASRKLQLPTQASVLPGHPASSRSGVSHSPVLCRDS